VTPPAKKRLTRREQRARAQVRARRRQQEAARQRARARCVFIAGRWIAAHIPVDRHGTVTTANYHGCQCDPCMACMVKNNPSRRAELRRQWLARRELVNGDLVATHLPARKHGTPSASDYYGCRCPVCTEAQTLRSQTRKPRRRKRAT
jgi:hypothetical protein